MSTAGEHRSGFPRESLAWQKKEEAGHPRDPDKMEHEKDPRNRAAIRPGMTVDIVTKGDQRSGKLVRGTVREILTGSGSHPHGIKVRLTDGRVGRVKTIVEPGGGEDG